MKRILLLCCLFQLAWAPGGEESQNSSADGKLMLKGPRGNIVSVDATITYDSVTKKTTLGKGKINVTAKKVIVKKFNDLTKVVMVFQPVKMINYYHVFVGTYMRGKNLATYYGDILAFRKPKKASQDDETTGDLEEDDSGFLSDINLTSLLNADQDHPECDKCGDTESCEQCKVDREAADQYCPKCDTDKPCEKCKVDKAAHKECDKCGADKPCGKCSVKGDAKAKKCPGKCSADKGKCSADKGKCSADKGKCTRDSHKCTRDSHKCTRDSHKCTRGQKMPKFKHLGAFYFVKAIKK